MVSTLRPDLERWLSSKYPEQAQKLSSLTCESYEDKDFGTVVRVATAQGYRESLVCRYKVFRTRNPNGQLGDVIDGYTITSVQQPMHAGGMYAYACTRSMLDAEFEAADQAFSVLVEEKP